KKTENKVSHVRPHARNAADTYELPIADKLTGLTEYTKHCFWLNASYVKDEIYLK
ncbi:MAG: DNA mismatch repair protein, partial [Flavobacteriaceae bacterium]|nr:DNA mismatch repair protein [Flavobacteriaceae bacterium]